MRVKIKKININEYKVNSNERDGLEFRDAETYNEITSKTKAVYLTNGKNFKGSRLKIPSTYKELPVIRIKWNAFASCIKLKEVIIPDTVTVIEDSAFANCINLEKITLPNSIIRIEEYSFMNCSMLKEVNIPIDIKFINKYAFKDCINLRTDIKDELINKWGCEI